MEPPKEPVNGGGLDPAVPGPGVAKGSPSTPKPAPAKVLPKTRAKAPLSKKAPKASQIPPKALDAAAGKEQERPRVDGAAPCSASQPVQPLTEVGEAPSPACPPDGAREGLSQPQLPVMEPAQPTSLPPASTLLPSESPSEEPAAKRAKPVIPEAAVSPAAAELRPTEAQEPEMTPQMRRIISEAIAQGIAASIQQHRPASSAASDNALRQGQAAPSMNTPETLGKELPLSGDKGGNPNTPAFVRLFSPDLFTMLLHKAKAAAGIEADPATCDTALSFPNNLLFSEPTIDKEEIPCPNFFLDVVKRQWAALGKGPNPSTNDKRFYNVGPNLTATLEPPTIDEAVATYAASTILSTNMNDALNPEEKRTEMTLVIGHKSAAWAVKSAMAASFFNRTSLLWLKQMQARIPATDLQTHEDINNLIAAAEFSADATLNSARFASRAIGCSVTARRLLWLRPWQSDMTFKWKLACTHFKGEKLFGEALEPILIETKDKKKVLPSMSKCAGQKSLPYIRKPSLKAAKTAHNFSQPQRAYFKQHDGQSVRPGHRGRRRKQSQSKRRFFPRSSRSLQSQDSRGPAATGDCSPKGFEEVGSNSPPKKTQQISGIQEIQNPVHTGEHPGGRHSDVNRSHGIVSTGHYVADSPTISMDMQHKPALPVQSPHDTSNVLLSPQNYLYSRPTVYGRHVDQILTSPPCHREPTHHDQSSSVSFRESGIQSQQQQETLDSYQQDAPPSSIYRDDMYSFLIPGPPGQHQRSGEQDSIVPNIASRPRLTIVRQDGVVRLHCSRGMFAYQNLTEVPPAYPEIQQEQFNYRRPSPITSRSGVEVTERNQGMSIQAAEPSHHSYRRQYAQLESPDRDPDGRRPLDRRGMTNQHQPARDPSRPHSPPTDPDHHRWPPYIDPSRERSHQGPYEPPREHPLEDIDYRRQDPIKGPPVVDATMHNQGMSIQEAELPRSRGRFSQRQSPDRDPDGRRPADNRGMTYQRQPGRAQIRPRSSRNDPHHYRQSPPTDSSRKRRQ